MVVSLRADRRRSLRPPLAILVATTNDILRTQLARSVAGAGDLVAPIRSLDEMWDALEHYRFDAFLIDLVSLEDADIGAVRLLRFVHLRRHLPGLVGLLPHAEALARRGCRADDFDAIWLMPFPFADAPALLARLARARIAKVISAQQASVANGGRPWAELPSLDPARLAALQELEDGDGFAAGLYARFLDDAEQTFAEMAAMIGAGRWPELRRALEALRSSATHLGAVAIAGLCRLWLRGAGVPDGRDRHLLAALRTELARLRVSLPG